MSEKALEIMRNPVYKVKESDKVETVIEKFVEHGISGLPVVNEYNQIAGYISDGDIMRYIGRYPGTMIDFLYISVYLDYQDVFADRIRELKDLNVMRIAKTKVVKVQFDMEIEDIATILGQKKIKKVPVERNGVLVGIISRGDVLRYVYNTFLQN
jgi:CBS domain-containing protein